MKPAMTGQQADALAAFLVSLRPGQARWTKAAVYDALTTAAAKFTPDAETLARASIRAALTGSIISPEVIPMPGAHWESVDHTPTHEPKRADRCDRCHDRHMPSAPCTPAPSSDLTSRVAEARRAIRKTKRHDPSTPEQGA
jgi:hypothetical protein